MYYISNKLLATVYCKRTAGEVFYNIPLFILDNDKKYTM